MSVVDASSVVDRDWGLFVDGKMLSGASGRGYEVRNPARAEVLTRVPIADPGEVDAAVEAAHRAYLSWRRVSLDERLKAVKRCQAVLLEHGEELSALDAANGGNPIHATRADARGAASALDRVLAAARALRGDAVPGASHGDFHMTLWEPVGVVGMIIAFNHPTIFAVQALGPIAVGNAVVLKPSEQVPLSALRLAELFADVLPAGVFNVVTGDGTTGRALVTHPAVSAISFIGSSAVGRQIIRDAAETAVKRTVLELGGKNPLVVCAGAPIDRVADAAVDGMNFDRCQGQSCSSTSRVLVEASIHDELTDAIAERMRALSLGDPLDEDTQVGSLVSPAQQERVLGFVAGAKEEGAAVALGGTPPADAELQRGAYVEPTLLVDVAPDMTIAREEVFGPVLSVIPWRSETEALEIANSVRYGLTASVWSPEVDRVQRLVAGVEAARIYVNSPIKGAHGVAVPAWKDSGTGLTGDWAMALADFVRFKAVHMLGA